MQGRSSTTSLGRLGEARAADFLEREGYTILKRNFRSRRAEIDIVARKGSALVFVEVKHWTTIGIEGLEYAIDRRKQRKIIEASKAFMKENAGGERSVRYDVVFVGRGDTEVKHIVDAFAEQA